MYVQRRGLARGLPEALGLAQLAFGTEGDVWGDERGRDLPGWRRGELSCLIAVPLVVVQGPRYWMSWRGEAGSG